MTRKRFFKKLMAILGVFILLFNISSNCALAYSQTKYSSKIETTEKQLNVNLQDEISKNQLNENSQKEISNLQPKEISQNETKTYKLNIDSANKSNEDGIVAKAFNYANNMLGASLGQTKAVKVIPSSSFTLPNNSGTLTQTFKEFNESTGEASVELRYKAAPSNETTLVLADAPEINFIIPETLAKDASSWNGDGTLTNYRYEKLSYINL